MAKKYLTFDPWWGGMNNVRMSYEIAAAMATVTGRTLVLPPKVYVLFFSDHSKKETYFDFWKIWDKSKFIRQFDTTEYVNVPELQKYNTSQQYFDGICRDYPCITFGDRWSNHGPQQWMDKYLLFGEIQEDAKFNDWQKDERPLMTLNREQDILHFPSSLFGYWYYHIYNEEHHNIKDKLKQGLQLRPEFKEKALELLPKDFDALHIRRGDFLNTRKPSTEILYENLATSLEGKVRKDVPLFIATDEKDKSLFDFLKKDYDIQFLNDLTEVEDYEALALDMEICSNAYYFYGSKYSTFTDYIHILRHYKNKNDYSRTGLNYQKPFINYKELPWRDEQYAWDNLWVHMY